MTPEHLNVVSYLLGAIVFSVGFLSARLHATADAQRAEANNASWRIREILARNDPLAPYELTRLLPIVEQANDSIARLLRWMNRALVLGASLVVVDFYRLATSGAELSPDSPFLMGVLATSCIAVGIVGEADATHVQRSTQRALSQTTLGHVAKLERALRDGTLEVASAEVDELRRAFPDWGLLFEATAWIALRSGDSRRALQMVLRHLGEGGDAYLSATVGCAAASVLDEPATALEILSLIELRRALTPVERRLRDALRLRAGHLDLVFDEERRDIGGADSAYDLHEQRALVSIGSDDLILGGSRSALDLQPTDEASLDELLATLAAWNRPGDLGAGVLPGSPFAELISLSFEGQISDQTCERLLVLVDDEADGETVEALGFFLLVGGRARDAVVILERAVRMRPRSARAHWTLAASCWVWGWEDKAQESLERATALEPEDLLLVATRRRFLSSDAADVVSSLDLDAAAEEWSPIQRVELALLGIDTSSAPASVATPREQFRERVTAMARASASPASAVSDG